MRRLLALTTSLMFLELIFFTVLSPLLPEFKHELGLSTSQAGVLVATYAVGSAAGAVPSVLLALRFGVRPTAIASLAGLAVMSGLFGAVRGYDALLAARFGQGLAGAACWTAGMLWLLDATPRARRGELLGIAFGVSESGAIVGPVLGGAAAAIGRGVAFSIVAALCLVIAAMTVCSPAPPRSEQARLRLVEALASARVRKALWITLLPAVLLAAVSVLAPLQQHALGAGSAQIATAFAAAALLGVAIRPLYGRWTDRQGPLRPTRVGLLACAITAFALPWMRSSLAAATVLVVALIAIGVLWAPVMVLLSDACTAAGFRQVLVVAIMGLSWPPGNIAGAAGGGALAQAIGQRITYAVIAAIFVLGALALSGRRAPVTDPAAGERLPLPRT
jgi:predicted MFS family arabinose efflux permease